jgi:formylglycine-generating enzyme
MRSTKLLTLMAAALGVLGVMPASGLITLDSVYVGDIGNPNDPATGYGAVAYGYSIGKYEVTLNQYCAFLNAVAATDTYGLYNPSMGTVAYSLGISRSGASGSYSYSVIGSGDRPVTYVSWFDAARFVNWLQSGQPTGAQNASSTERGAYTLDGAMYGVVIARNAGATYGLPSENEWYKAAYYQPLAQGGPTSSYWLYPTRSNTQPNSRNGSATDPNSANYYYDDGIANGYNGGYAVNNSTTTVPDTPLTDAGAFSLASSFYGTFDQGGNAWEWNDAVITEASRGLRGAAWNFTEDFLRASYRFSHAPSFEGFNSGFRIAVVPEPAAGGLTILGVALLACKPKRTVHAVLSR